MGDLGGDLGSFGAFDLPTPGTPIDQIPLPFRPDFNPADQNGWTIAPAGTPAAAAGGGAAPTVSHLVIPGTAAIVVPAGEVLGFVVWGQKTLQRLPTALDRVNVRRMMLVAEKEIRAASRNLLFEPNDALFQRQFTTMVSQILESTTGSDFYYWLCTSSRYATISMGNQMSFPGHRTGPARLRDNSVAIDFPVPLSPFFSYQTVLTR